MRQHSETNPYTNPEIRYFKDPYTRPEIRYLEVPGMGSIIPYSPTGPRIEYKDVYESPTYARDKLAFSRARNQALAGAHDMITGGLSDGLAGALNQIYEEVCRYDESRSRGECVIDELMVEQTTFFPCLNKSDHKELLKLAIQCKNGAAVREITSRLTVEQLLDWLGHDTFEKTLKYFIFKNNLYHFEHRLNRLKRFDFSIQSMTFYDCVNALTHYFIVNTIEGKHLYHWKRKTNDDVTTVIQTFLEPPPENELFQSSFLLFKHYLYYAIADKNYKRIKLIKKNVGSMCIIHSTHRMELLEMIVAEEKKYQNSILASIISEKDMLDAIATVRQDAFGTEDEQKDLIDKIFSQFYKAEKCARDEINSERLNTIRTQVDSTETELRIQLEKEFDILTIQTAYKERVDRAVFDWRLYQNVVISPPVRKTTAAPVAQSIKSIVVPHTSSSSAALRVGLGVMFGFIGVSMITLSIVSCFLSHGLSIGLSYQTALFGAGLISNALWLLAGGTMIACAAEAVTTGKISSLFFQKRQAIQIKNAPITSPMCL